MLKYLMNNSIWSACSRLRFTSKDIVYILILFSFFSFLVIRQFYARSEIR